MSDAWFDGWAPLGRTIGVGVVAYVSLVLLLRVSGKRTLAKLNAFDLVVTVALGSTLASVLTSRTLPFAQGATAFAVLVALQFAITWGSVRFGAVRRAVRSEPTLLAHRGAVLDDAMRRERVTRDELEAAVRTSGARGVDETEAVVLETDGSFSVTRRAPPGAAGRARSSGAGTPPPPPAGRGSS